MSKAIQPVGFIGLGVMGEPMCRNPALKSGVRIVGYDREASALERLERHGVKRAGSVHGAVSTGCRVSRCAKRSAVRRAPV